MAKDFLSEQVNLIFLTVCELKSSIYLHIISAEFFCGLMEKEEIEMIPHAEIVLDIVWFKA